MTLPKAELHLHIEGAAPPALVAELAERHGIDVSAILGPEGYRWDDFFSFLAAYDLAASVFREEEDYARLAETYLSGIAATGAIYAEIFVSPDHARAVGLSPDAYVAALSRGIERAREATEIEARMIVVGVRHLGPEAVEAAARFAARPTHPLVTGFGLAGDERAGDPADFARAFDIARDAGLGLTAHAGEFCGAEAVARTLDTLKPARLGHGVRAIEDGEVVRRIAAEGIVLEVCPRSNLALGVFSDPASHPLARLKAAGCRVTLNSDDPPFFATSLQAEYDFAAAHQGFSPADLAGATRTAIEAAFLGGEDRRRLETRFVQRLLASGAPSAS